MNNEKEGLQMGFADFVVAAVILAIVGISVAYIVNAKKKGVRCVGCPDGGACGKCNGACNVNK